MKGNRWMSAEERFSCQSKWVGECLEWQGALLHNGYGEIRVDGIKTKSHRYAYQRAFGLIPEGRLVLHKCDNPRCVNIDHLYLGDQKDNARDRDSRGRNGFSNKTHCKRGHEFTEENTYRWRSKRICKQCKKRHNRKRPLPEPPKESI